MEIKKIQLEWEGTLTPLEAVEKLIQHHTDHPTWGVQQTHVYHRDTRGYKGIAYNYFIYFDGKVVEGRGEHVGAHSGSDWNSRSLGICYQGDLHHEQNMSGEQLEAGAWLNAKFIKKYGLSVDDIIGHRDVSDTACPGDNFQMEELRAKVAELLREEEGTEAEDNDVNDVVEENDGPGETREENEENEEAEDAEDRDESTEPVQEPVKQGIIRAVSQLLRWLWELISAIFKKNG